MDPKWPKLSAFYVRTRLEAILGWFETPPHWPFWYRRPKSNFYYIPQIMTGLPERPEDRSVIFEVRALIFCMRTLYPYVDLGIFSQRPRSKLTFDGFFHQSHIHPSQNRPSFNVVRKPLEGSQMVPVNPKWPKLSAFYVGTTLEAIWDTFPLTFLMPTAKIQLLLFTSDNDWTAGASRTTFGQFWS